MHAQHIMRSPIFFEAIPIIDEAFDRFEINNDFEMVLREAETANFYHNTLNEEE
ncbi:MAG: hypothetical protein SFX19_05365 [Alphaproteobacteria bacterium]|nr:hypothetical protein [Alphaproteobacteria bacterium]